MSDYFEPAKKAPSARLSIIAMLFLTLLAPKYCSASMYIPSSFALVSSNDQFLLVMRSPIKAEYDNGRIFKLRSGKEIDLRDKFQTNGVFRLDTFECIQPLNWFADKGELFVSGDFKLLVRLNRFAVETQRKTNWCWALKFYNNGKEVKQYQVAQLVDIPNFFYLPYTTYGYHAEWYVEAMDADVADHTDDPVPDDEVECLSDQQFMLVTSPQLLARFYLTDGNVFLFDANTGEIKQEWRHRPLIILGLIVVGILTVLFLMLFFVFRIFRKGFRWIKSKQFKSSSIPLNTIRLPLPNFPNSVDS